MAIQWLKNFALLTIKFCYSVLLYAFILLYFIYCKTLYLGSLGTKKKQITSEKQMSVFQPFASWIEQFNLYSIIF